MGDRDRIYMPIDDWAETKHPKFLENIRASLDTLADKLDEEARYVLVRHVMIFARQEFEPNG